MVIESWRHLMAVLNTMDEPALVGAINMEVSLYRRKMVITRLHSRYNMLRKKREVEALINGEMLL